MERSEQIGQLAKALAAARKDFPPIRKTTPNPYFGSKYADLETLIDATKESLCANGLAVVQLPSSDLEHCVVTVKTLLVHSSGEWLAGEISVPGAGVGKDGKEKFTAQTIGSAVSYARRYSFQSLLNLAAEDDDGNTVSSPTRRAQQTPNAAGIQQANDAPKGQETESALISEGQRRRLFALTKQHNVDADKLKDHLFLVHGVASSRDISKAKYDTICAWVEAGGNVAAQ